MALPESRSNPKVSLDDAMKAVPARPREFLIRALAILLAIPLEKQERALRLGADTLDSSFALDEIELGEELSLASNDAKQAVSAARFLGALLASHSEATARQLVDGLVANGFISGENIGSALAFAETVVATRGQLTEEFEKSVLRNSVLPSLQKFDTVVDIRLSGGEASPPSAVPVVLFMIDTDADRETLWCQLSKTELKAVVQKLNKTLERLEVAEAWIRSKNPTAGE